MLSTGHDKIKHNSFRVVVATVISIFFFYLGCSTSLEKKAEEDKQKQIEKLEAQIKEKEEEIRNLYL